MATADWSMAVGAIERLLLWLPLQWSGFNYCDRWLGLILGVLNKFYAPYIKVSDENFGSVPLSLVTLFFIYNANFSHK